MSGQEDIAFLVLDKDLNIKTFNMERCRSLASDPNPHLSGTARAMLQLIEACASIVRSSENSEEAYQAIMDLTIEDGVTKI